MFTIVFFEEKTRKVFLVLPLILVPEEGDGVELYYEKGLVWTGYKFQIFSDCEPVFYTDKDGDICLKENSFIINSGDFME